MTAARDGRCPIGGYRRPEKICSEPAKADRGGSKRGWGLVGECCCEVLFLSLEAENGARPRPPLRTPSRGNPEEAAARIEAAAPPMYCMGPM